MVSEYAETSALLAAHLNERRFGNPRFLDWFYGANPRGRAIVEDVDDEHGRRIAHYGVLPTTYRTPAGLTPFIFTSNVATDPSSRRKGLFREMADRIYPRAAATGAPGMAGTGNAASSVIVVDRFGWSSLGSMPALVCLPAALPRGIRDIRVDPAFLAGGELDRLASDLDWVPVRDWVQSWSADFLRWRLANPDSSYVLHVGPDALAVSTRDHGPLGAPAAVLCKIFPRPGARLPIRGGRYVAAACRAQRAPVCIYVGWNAHARVRGIPLPMRLRPSPLVVIFRSLDEQRAPTDQFRLDTWELLDGDAY
jgi:GNAT superfamily N-acetyltransferase